MIISSFRCGDDGAVDDEVGRSCAAARRQPYLLWRRACPDCVPACAQPGASSGLDGGQRANRRRAWRTPPPGGDRRCAPSGDSRSAISALRRPSHSSRSTSSSRDVRPNACCARRRPAPRAQPRTPASRSRRRKASAAGRAPSARRSPAPRVARRCRRRPARVPVRTGSPDAAQAAAASRQRPAICSAYGSAQSAGRRLSRAPARQRQNASSPMNQGCRCRCASGSAALASRSAAVQVAALERCLGARGAHRRDALQRAARIGQRERLVERLGGAGVAAAHAQPAQRDQRHHCVVVLAVSARAIASLACVAASSQRPEVQLAQGQPRRGVERSAIELVAGGERDASRAARARPRRIGTARPSPSRGCLV